MTYIIKRMLKDELQIAIEWANKEGWNPGLNDADSYYYADPNGFFIGLLDGIPIATGAAVVYDGNFAFCGLYVVKSDVRNQGYGIQLTHERLRYTGDRVTGLDGVINMTAKYERLGYVAAHKNIRYELKNPNSLFSAMKVKTKHLNIHDLKTIDFKKILKFDRRYFPAPRSAFLENWINQNNAFSIGYVVNEELKGYGVIRKCQQGYKIGPLFAETYSIAEDIFTSLCAKAQEGPIYLDIPEPNKEALSLVANHKMTSVFEVLRMYRNGKPDFDLSGVYGFTTFEIG